MSLSEAFSSSLSIVCSCPSLNPCSVFGLTINKMYSFGKYFWLSNKHFPPFHYYQNITMLKEQKTLIFPESLVSVNVNGKQIWWMGCKWRVALRFLGKCSLSWSRQNPFLFSIIRTGDRTVPISLRMARPELTGLGSLVAFWHTPQALAASPLDFTLHKKVKPLLHLDLVKYSLFILKGCILSG